MVKSDTTVKPNHLHPIYLRFLFHAITNKLGNTNLKDSPILPRFHKALFMISMFKLGVAWLLPVFMLWSIIIEKRVFSRLEPIGLAI